jgi:predicted nucleic acid-binding Zn finger protein
MTQEVTTRAAFPSVDWFRAIQEIVNHDDGYKHFGTCDTVIGLKVPDLEKYYRVTFEAFEVADISESSDSEAENTDFWLEMPYASWREMIENIKANGKADLHHTLNTIDLEIPEGLARSNDGYRRDAFYRFNQTFQYFFDTSAKIDTTFA